MNLGIALSWDAGILMSYVKRYREEADEKSKEILLAKIKLQLANMTNKVNNTTK